MHYKRHLHQGLINQMRFKFVAYLELPPLLAKTLLMLLVYFNISTPYGAFHQLIIRIRTRKTSYNFMRYGRFIICGRRLEAVRLPSLYSLPFFTLPWWALSLYQSTVYLLIFIYLSFYLVNLRNSSLSKKPLLSVSIALKAAAALSIFTFFLGNRKKSLIIIDYHWLSWQLLLCPSSHFSWSTLLTGLPW